MRYFRLTTLILCIAQPLWAMSLSQTVETALTQSPEWAEQSYNYQAKSLNPGIVMGAMLPGLTANIEQDGGVAYLSSNAQEPASFNQTQVVMQLNVPIYRPERLAEYGSACYQYDIDQLIYQSAKESFISDVVKRYFEVLLKAKNHALSEQFLDVRSKFYDDTQEKYHVGLVSLSDLKGAEASRDQAVARTIQAQYDLCAAQEQLLNILPNTPKKLKDADLSMHFKYPEHLSIQKPHYSLKIADKSVELADSLLKRTQSALYPEVVSSTTYSHQPFNQNSNISASQVRSSLTVSWTPVQGGTLLAGIQQSRYQQQAAKSAQLQAIRDYATQNSLAQRKLRTFIAQLSAQKESLNSSKVYLSTVEASYDAGQSTITDVIDAQESVTEQEILVFQSIYNCLKQYFTVGLLLSYPPEDLIESIDLYLNQHWDWETKEA